MFSNFYFSFRRVVDIVVVVGRPTRSLVHALFVLRSVACQRNINQQPVGQSHRVPLHFGHCVMNDESADTKTECLCHKQQQQQQTTRADNCCAKYRTLHIRYVFVLCIRASCACQLSAGTHSSHSQSQPQKNITIEISRSVLLCLPCPDSRSRCTRHCTTRKLHFHLIVWTLNSIHLLFSLLTRFNYFALCAAAFGRQPMHGKMKP